MNANAVHYRFSIRSVRRFRQLLVATALFALSACATGAASAEPLKLEEQLIVACHRVDVVQVVQLLRKGANVQARFGRHDEELFMDKWIGGTPIGHDKWTALMAVSAAQKYPDPPKEFPNIWEDSERVRAEQRRIGKEVLEKRRTDELAIMHILLSHGARLDEDDGYGATALHMAVSNHKPKLARALLGFGANPNTKRHVYIDGADDITPLHDACNSREMFQLLLDHGANASAKDSEGRTPVEWVSWDRGRNFDVVVKPGGAPTVTRNEKEPK